MNRDPPIIFKTEFAGADVEVSEPSDGLKLPAAAPTVHKPGLASQSEDSLVLEVSLACEAFPALELGIEVGQPPTMELAVESEEAPTLTLEVETEALSIS